MSSINIKNEHAVRLIKELAELEGESMTTVTIRAVEDRLERQRHPIVDEQRMQYWLDFGQRVRERMNPDDLGKDFSDDLYAERGLPG